MKLTTTHWVTLDGVMQGLGAQDEDRRGGFDRGGWSAAYYDDETAPMLNQIYGSADAYLFGRWTYEVFAGSWGSGMGEGSPISDALNSRPKYVVSKTLTDPQWADTTVLSGDLASAIAELKAKPGGQLVVPGSRTLVQWLLDHQLVDEMNLIVCPIVLGEGARLFPDTGPDLAFELLSSDTAANGAVNQYYRPVGRPLYDTATAEPTAGSR